MAEDLSIFLVGSLIVFLCLVSLALRLYEHRQYDKVSKGFKKGK